MHRRPAPRLLWLDVSEAPPAHCGASFDALDSLVEPLQQVVERSKPPAGGGTLYVWASRNTLDFGPMARLSADQLANSAR